VSARNKARGYELEREVVLAAQAAGLEAKRVFGSGAHKAQLGEDFAGDVVLAGLRVECKRRKGGFKLLYDAFEQDDADVVCVRADRSPRIYLLRERLFLELLREREEKNDVS
jgi:Holliday junction resolvase